jgi:hypothetical protein
MTPVHSIIKPAIKEILSEIEVKPKLRNNRILSALNLNVKRILWSLIQAAVSLKLMC